MATTVVTHPFTVIHADPDEVGAGVLGPDRHAAAVESIRVHGAAIVLGAVDLGVVDSLREAMLADLPRAIEKPHALNVHGHIQHNPPLSAAHLHRDVIANPIGLSIIRTIIGPVQLSLYTGNTMLGGTTQEQPLHWDEHQLWPGADVAPPPAQLTMNIPLVDVDVANGALEVWPGTHHDLRSGQQPLRGDDGLPVPPEWSEARRAEVPPVRVPLPRGAVLIRDGRLWHRGTTNTTDQPRPMVAACYNAWWFRPTAIDFHEDAEPMLRELGVRVAARFRADFDDQEWPPNWASSEAADPISSGRWIVMDVYVMLGPAGTMSGLRDRIARLDALGVTGVFVSDHLFFALGGDRSESYRADDPIVVLGAIAAMSERLSVGTLVANAGIVHPALLLRHFAQLAALVGGDRVLAGIGAGWNTEEFDALGIDMPTHRVRAARLEEACRLARALFDDGIATIDGDHVTARALPMAPKPDVPPRLLLGGGSDRFLELAGRYADVVDLNGSSRRRPLGRDLPVRDDRARRHSTTVDDLVDAAGRVHDVAQECGRPAPRLSVLVDTVALSGEPDDKVADCPYVLVGEPARLRDVVAERVERIGLDTVVVGESPDLDTLLPVLR